MPHARSCYPNRLRCQDAPGCERLSGLAQPDCLARMPDCLPGYGDDDDALYIRDDYDDDDDDDSGADGRGCSEDRGPSSEDDPSSCPLDAHYSQLKLMQQPAVLARFSLRSFFLAFLCVRLLFLSFFEKVKNNENSQPAIMAI